MWCMQRKSPPPPEGPQVIAIVETDDLIRELMLRWLQEARYLPVPIDPSTLDDFAAFSSAGRVDLVIADGEIRNVNVAQMIRSLTSSTLNGWQQNAPTQEEIEDTLEGYAELAHTPVALH